MIGPRLLLALPLIAVAALTLWAVRRRSPLDPGVLLLVTTAIVGLFYPLASAFVEPLTWRHGAHLPGEYVLGAQTQYLAFLLGVAGIVAGVRLTRQVAASPVRYVAADRDAVAFRDLWIATGMVVGGGLLYALYVKQVGLGPLLDRHNFAEKYRVSSGLGALYFGLNLVICGCLWAEASALSRVARLSFRAVAAAVCVWSIGFVAVRTYAVALFLGYIYLACRRTGFTLARVRPSLVIALMLGYAGVEAFAMLRGAWHGSFVDAVATLQRQPLGIERSLGQVVGGSELAHPFLTTMELARFEEGGELGGSSYAEAALGLLPLWLNPDRPPTPAQEFARRHYPSLEARGGGTAFSVVGEAWWNFGPLLGPFAIGFLLAWLLAQVERRSEVLPHSYLARFQPYLVHMIVLLHRGSAVSIAKHLFSLLIPAVLLAASGHLLWQALSVRRRSGGHSGVPRTETSLPLAGGS